MTWWNNATTQQKLIQLDGGIALGMTAAQIAVASGSSRNIVSDFASRHGRRLTEAKRGPRERRPMRAVFDIASEARSSGWAMP